jgi:medium-chain acyl-[acyl-carrier-protein] hydrolase
VQRLHREVLAFQAGAGGRLTLPWLCAVFQDGAERDASALGVGIREMARDGLVWVLQRLRAEIAELPRFGETFTLLTWPAGAERLLARREFEVTSEDGRTLARATSRWVVMDQAARKPVRPPETVRRLVPEPRPHALEGLPSDIPPGPAEVRWEKRFEVLRRDLDVAGHANNTRYVEWALETLPDTIAEGAAPHLLDIVFRREAVKGDVVVARTGPHPMEADVHLHVLRRESDGEELARALTRHSAG